MTRSIAALFTLTFVCFAVTAASPGRATVVMPGVTVEMVKNAYTSWCILNAMDVVEADDNQVACAKPITGGRGALIQMLANGANPPVIRLQFVFAQTGADVVATAKQQLETITPGAVVQRQDLNKADVIAGTQAILDEVAASLKKMAPTALPAEAVEKSAGAAAVP